MTGTGATMRDEPLTLGRCFADEIAALQAAVEVLQDRADVLTRRVVALEAGPSPEGV
ncbi:MAG: hypothetical protein OXG44_17340 [Gammaproteobacteria bacterium]|nr:hypothetical protein [Gammaproteobacteria bacterium]